MSTNRYTNAGDVNLGTPVNNMASRVKAYGWIDCMPATPAMYATFNLSSLGDNGVGLIYTWFAAVMATSQYSCQVTCQPAVSVLDNFDDTIGKTAQYCQVRHYENSAPKDTPNMDFLAMGNLA